MGGGDKCCVGGCNNDRRYPERYVIRSHVNKLGFHKPSKSEDVIRSWCIQVQKGRKDFKIGKSRESVIVCSNHFVDGKPIQGTIRSLPSFSPHLSIPKQNHHINGVNLNSVKRKLVQAIQPQEKFMVWMRCPLNVICKKRWNLTSS